jgi:hypothetical protein
MKIRRFLILALLFILNSCALYGPTYSQPNVHEDDAWVSKDKLAKIDDNIINLPDTAWWQKFKDPELNSLVADALKIILIFSRQLVILFRRKVLYNKCKWVGCQQWEPV